MAQPAPQFSGINLQSVVHEKMQNTSGVHEWGEMHERYIQYPIEYDIKRWTHTKGGAVILGKRNPDGTVKWYRLHPDKSGKYLSETALGYVNTRDGKELALKDIRCMRSDRGSYYAIEVTEGQFALVSRGFRQVGGIYGSAKEAIAAWDNQ